MASVWQHPKSINWFARYRGPQGKTINRSTGTSDRNEALRVAGTWEIEAARERDKKKGEVSPGGISDTIARAERLARQGRFDVLTGRDILNRLLVAAGQPSLDTMTHRVWCDSWEKSKAAAVKEQSRAKYGQVCRNWLSSLGAKADKPLESVSKVDVIAYRDRLAREGLAPNTVNHILKLLRSIYAGAVEQGHLGRNPFAGVDPVRRDDSRQKRLPFSLAELEKLLKAAEGDWKGLILLAATTGLRLMDTARLQWRNLDLDARLIRVTTAKTGAKLELPIHDEFRSWLRRQIRGVASAPVFPELFGKSGAGKSGLSMAFKRLMARAEITEGTTGEKKGRGRAISRKSFHSLRHFAATQLAASGVRADVARAITGHADEATHENYVTPDKDVLRLAVAGIQLAPVKRSTKRKKRKAA